MLELVVEIDGHPLSRWGCDGAVCATPTGSTAYAFSAGGPVVWPEVEAMLLVPISAHALFARPLVVSPASTVAIELLPGTAPGVLWCDGRRTHDVSPAPGSRSDAGAPGPARPHPRAAVHRPARREVRPARARVARPVRRRRAAVAGATVFEEIRIRHLGVIEEAEFELAAGLTVVTGETGAGKTMVVESLGLLLGGRADPGLVRRGATAAVVEGRVRLPAESSGGRTCDARPARTSTRTAG